MKYAGFGGNNSAATFNNASNAKQQGRMRSTQSFAVQKEAKSFYDPNSCGNYFADNEALRGTTQQPRIATSDSLPGLPRGESEGFFLCVADYSRTTEKNHNTRRRIPVLLEQKNSVGSAAPEARAKVGPKGKQENLNGDLEMASKNSLYSEGQKQGTI